MDPGPVRRGKVGSYSVAEEERPRRRAAWLWPLALLLGLLLLGGLAWAFFANRDKDAGDRSGAAGTPAASAPATPGGGTGAGAAAASGSLTVNGESILPLSGGDLGRYAGQTVVARSVTVQSVPADEGFWLGTSETDRVWVQLTGGAGESVVTVRPGDRVSFDAGSVVATAPGFADQVGVTAEEGAQQLESQRQHLEVATSALRVG